MGLVERQYDDFIWGLKYRPREIDKVILPERFRNQFQTIIDTKQIPNMLLSGPRGCGKTTVCFCLADQIGCDVKYINMSKDNSIDMIRTELTQFATSMSFEDGKKLVIGDEFDRLSLQAIDALKADIEAYSKNCVFVFTSNDKYKFASHPVMSRLQEIDFQFSKEETLAMKKQFYGATMKILDGEGVKFEKKAVGHVVNLLFPDMRKVLNELQKLSIQFKKVLRFEDVGAMMSLGDVELFFGAIKDRDFGYVREYISGLTVDHSQVYSLMFGAVEKYVADESFPEAVQIIDEQQFRSAFSTDKQIPLTACCMRLMDECKWK